MSACTANPQYCRDRAKQAGTKPAPITALLNYHVADNDQVAALPCERLQEINLAEGMLYSELLESTLALIYKSWQLHKVHDRSTKVFPFAKHLEKPPNRPTTRLALNEYVTEVWCD